MKNKFHLLLIILLLFGCRSNKKNFQPMVNKIKEKIVSENPDIKSIDTIYLLVRTLTPKDLMVLQAIEYTWAATEAKKNKIADSSDFDEKSYEILDKSESLDNSTPVYYYAAPYIIFTTKEAEKRIGNTRIIFDKQFNFVPKYSIIKKIANSDNTEFSSLKYTPFKQEEYQTLEKNKILKYY